jgi:Flp pilus assembly protein TadD
VKAIRVIARPGRFEEAEAHVRRAIELTPNRSGPHENLGVLMVAQGRFRDSEAEFRRAIAIAPKYAPSWNSLGVALANQGLARDAEAEAAFREASRLSPRMVDARANLGLLYLRAGRYAEAIAPLREALRLDPSQTAVWNNLGRAISGAAAQRAASSELVSQGGETLVSPRSTRYHLPNTIGNLVDRAVTFATLVSGGVMDECPNLKICLGHGGGYTCYGIGRLDRGWQARAEARVHISKPPSAYLRRFYYDCIVYTEPALRFLIDTVGIDRVVFGTDWPYDMALDWPVSWILAMDSLSQDEKEAILWKNLAKLLGL